MYVDIRDDWPPPKPLKPEHPRRRFSKRQETVVVCAIGLGLLMLVVWAAADASLSIALPGHRPS